MPTYVYKFTDTGETVEVQQAFTDSTLTEYPHPADGEVRSVKKVFTPVGVTFKGSGFYKTDSRGSKPKSGSTATTTSTDTAGSSSSDSSTTTSTTPSTASTSNGSSSNGSSSNGSSSSSSTSSSSTGAAAAS